MNVKKLPNDSIIIRATDGSEALEVITTTEIHGGDLVEGPDGFAYILSSIDSKTIAVAMAQQTKYRIRLIPAPIDQIWKEVR